MLDFVALAPSEVALFVFQNLIPPELARCERVSQTWNSIAHDAWRDLAIRLGYASVNHQTPAEALDDSETGISLPSTHRTLRHIQTFKALCRKRISMEKAWIGKNGRIKTKMDLWPTNNSNTWRVKLDDEEDTIISTTRNGGIQAVDFETHETLWEIPTGNIRPYAHLEFQNGYMIFDRSPDIEGHFEVYKSHRLCSKEELSSINHNEDQERKRGNFISLGKLNSPHSVRAYKFNYPNLLVATWNKFIITFDVPNMKIVDVFKCNPPSRRRRNSQENQNVVVNDDENAEDEEDLESRFNYIDFDKDYVFLVGMKKEVFVYSRKSGKLIWSLEEMIENSLPKSFGLSSSGQQLDRKGMKPLCDFKEQELVNQETIGWFNRPENEPEESREESYSWSAIHPDQKTNTLVILGETDIILLRDYKKIFEQRENLLETSSSSSYLDSPPSSFVNINFDSSSNPKNFPSLLMQSHLTVGHGKAVLVVFVGENSDELLENLPNPAIFLIDLDPKSSFLNNTNNNNNNNDQNDPKDKDSNNNSQNDKSENFKIHSTLKFQQETRKKTSRGIPFGSLVLSDCSCLQMNQNGILLSGFQKFRNFVSFFDKKGERREDLDMIWLGFDQVAEGTRFKVHDEDEVEDEDEDEDGSEDDKEFELEDLEDGDGWEDIEDDDEEEEEVAELADDD